MKYIFFPLLFICSVAGAQNRQIEFLHAKLDSVYAKAKAENKLVYVDCYTTWCGPCKWMAKEIYTKDNVADFFNENFVNYKLDMEKGEGKLFRAQFGINSFPTHMFIEARRRRPMMVHRFAGSMPDSNFIMGAETALNEDLRLGTLKAKYNAGNRDTDFIKNYVNVLYQAGQRTEADNICYWYFKDIDWSDLDDDQLKLLFSFVKMDNPYLPQFFANAHRLEKLVNENRMYNKTLSLITRPLWVGINKGKGDEGYQAYKEQVQSLNYSKKELLQAEVDLIYYLKKDFDKFMEIAPAAIAKHFNENSERLNGYAWDVYENTNNIDYLKTALRWAEQSVKLDENYANSDTKMRLLYKLGKRKQALKLANRVLLILEENENKRGIEAHKAVMQKMKAGEDISEMM